MARGRVAVRHRSTWACNRHPAESARASTRSEIGGAGWCGDGDVRCDRPLPPDRQRQRETTAVREARSLRAGFSRDRALK
jgi:hypothetical protein